MGKEHGEDQRYRNYVILAETFYKDGEKHKAIEFYEKALGFGNTNEENIEALFNIALIYDEMGFPIKSRDTYNDILKIDEKNPGAYFIM